MLILYFSFFALTVNGEENPGRFLSDSCFMVSVKPTISYLQVDSSLEINELKSHVCFDQNDIVDKRLSLCLTCVVVMIKHVNLISIKLCI
jgi:hypothetical protein